MIINSRNQLEKTNKSGATSQSINNQAKQETKVKKDKAKNSEKEAKRIIVKEDAKSQVLALSQ